MGRREQPFEYAICYEYAGHEREAYPRLCMQIVAQREALKSSLQTMDILMASKMELPL